MWRCEARSGRLWRGEGVRLLAHEAHQRRLRGGKLLRHEGLWHPRWWRRSRCGRLAELAQLLAGRGACSWSGGAVGTVAAAATVTLILVRGGVETASVIPTPVGGGGGGAVPVSAVTAVPVEAAASVSVAAAHAPVALVLVHEVRVVGAASTVAHPTSWCAHAHARPHTRIPSTSLIFSL